jgi:hypothetical protein
MQRLVPDGLDHLPVEVNLDHVGKLAEELQERTAPEPDVVDGLASLAADVT